jgi:hypothetical protein
MLLHALTFNLAPTQDGYDLDLHDYDLYEFQVTPKQSNGDLQAIICDQ